MKTTDGDQLPAGTRVSGYQCLDCDHTDADVGSGGLECDQCGSDGVEQIVVSGQPLIGDEDADGEYYHYGLKAYVYTVEED